VVIGNSPWTTHTHLQGAKAIFQLHIKSLAFQYGCLSIRILFVVKTLQYFDAVIALSLGQPRVRFDVAGLDGWEAIYPYTEMDEIFGLARSLWEVVEDLTDLLAQPELHSEEAISQAQQLEARLQCWEPATLLGNEADAVVEEAMAQIAHSQKYSALLTLYAAIPQLTPCDREDPSQRGRPQHYKQPQEVYRNALESLLRVCVLSGPMSTLTWALYTVSTVAESASDRTILQCVFAKLAEQQHMNVVQSAMEEVQRRWQGGNRDGHEVSLFLG
jgi:hypothetical protein